MTTDHGLITACCITWNNPRALGELIESFRRQTYPNCELIILDDAGQYEQTRGHNSTPSAKKTHTWDLISTTRRFQSLGAKRNACASMANHNAEYLAIWDTDDIYLPHALERTVAALQRGPWAQPRHVLEWHRPPGHREGAALLRQAAHPRGRPDDCAYHGAWAYRRDAFWDVGGYPARGEEDNPLARAMLAAYGPSQDSTGEQPWYIYSRGTARTHISTMYQELAQAGRPNIWEEAYRLRGEETVKPVTQLDIRWHANYANIPIPGPEQTQGRPW